MSTSRGRSMTRRVAGKFFPPERSKSRNRSASRVTYAGSDIRSVSVSRVVGKSSVKSPLAIIGKGKGGTLKDRIRRVEKELKHDEVKYLLTNNVATTIGTTPSITLINACQRGNTVQSRSADEVTFLQIEISGILSTGNNNIVRMMIIADKHPESSTINFATTAPAINYAFAYQSGTALIPYQMMNLNNTDLTQFRVYYDETFNVQTTNVFNMPITIKKRLNMQTEYKGGNLGTISDITRNSLYFVIWQSGNSGAGCTFTYDQCLYFQDQ